MQKWEYLVLQGAGDFIRSANVENIDVKVDNRRFHVYLQELGRAGWEMVEIAYKDKEEFHIFLKRPFED